MSRQLLDKHRLLSLGLLTFSLSRMQPKATHQLLRDYLNSESLVSFNSFFWERLVLLQGSFSLNAAKEVCLYLRALRACNIGFPVRCTDNSVLYVAVSLCEDSRKKFLITCRL
jgi:hypothetical protein